MYNNHFTWSMTQVLPFITAMFPEIYAFVLIRVYIFLSLKHIQIVSKWKCIEIRDNAYFSYTYFMLFYFVVITVLAFLVYIFVFSLSKTLNIFLDESEQIANKITIQKPNATSTIMRQRKGKKMFTNHSVHGGNTQFFLFVFIFYHLIWFPNKWRFTWHTKMKYHTIGKSKTLLSISDVKQNSNSENEDAIVWSCSIRFKTVSGLTVFESNVRSSLVLFHNIHK